VAFLEENAGRIAFVTIDIGANDALGGNAEAIVANLPSILAQLRAAAGSEVAIVGMNYYNPSLPIAWATGGLPALKAAVAATVGFNNLLEVIYAAAGVPVADVEQAFSVTNFTLENGTTPTNVVRECAWACAPPPHGFDIHANNDGYGVIAEAFLDALS